MVLYWRAEQLLWMKHVTSAQGMEGCSTTAAVGTGQSDMILGSGGSSDGTAAVSPESPPWSGPPS